MLGDVPLLTAVRDYLARSRGFEPGVTVPRAVEELIALKRQDHVSGQYIASLTGILNRFSEAFPGEISQVTGAQIERWLREGDQSAVTRNNWLKRIKNLFTYAKRSGYLPKNEPTVAESLKPVARKTPMSASSRPKRCGGCWRPPPPEIVPFLAIGGFAGLRVAEICRLDWSAVSLERRIIELRAGQAKTASRRIVSGERQPGRVAGAARPAAARSSRARNSQAGENTGPEAGDRVAAQRAAPFLHQLPDRRGEERGPGGAGGRQLARDHFQALPGAGHRGGGPASGSASIRPGALTAETVRHESLC